VPELPPGSSMVEAYLKCLFERCARSAGRVLVADSEGQVIGFVGVLTRVLPEAPEDPPDAYAYVTDLVVLPPYRGGGVGHALLERAEALARESGVGRLELSVLSKNRVARELYRRRGYREVEIYMWKAL